MKSSDTSVQELVDNWRRRGRHLHVLGANSRIWRIGEGEQVVCVHGVPTSAYLYRKVLPALAERGLQGITFDLPGMGFAERPENFDYSWSGLAEWVVEAISAANIDRFHLVVHDIGGPVGFDVIRRIPDRIRSLTILNTMLHVASFRRPWFMEPFAHRGLGWIWLQAVRTPMLIMVLRVFGAHGGPSRDELRVYEKLLLRDDGGRAFLKIMRSFERTSAFEQRTVAALQNRTFPAQVIWGAQDRALRIQDYAPAICNTLGLNDWHEVYGKHFLQEDSPDEIATHVAALASGGQGGPDA